MATDGSDKTANNFEMAEVSRILTEVVDLSTRALLVGLLGIADMKKRSKKKSSNIYGAILQAVLQSLDNTDDEQLEKMKRDMLTLGELLKKTSTEQFKLALAKSVTESMCPNGWEEILDMIPPEALLGDKE